MPEQRTMLENLIPMLIGSESVEDINFIRQIIINEPLLNIILGNPNSKESCRTLQNRISHCKYRKYNGKRGWYGADSLLYVHGEYNNIALAIQQTLTNGYYWMYK